MHREAVRLAAHEARLRGNLSAMFVNLSRRSQMLAERQLGIIDSLEQAEQDPDRLSGLFRLDHLATRMRRNSENLLVLGGHEDPRKWSQPVPLLDVVRAAISEIEQYERIALNVQPGVLITGRAASDVVHLAAELIENATAFSSAQVLVTAGMLNSGGALIEITDEGLGIADQDLASANWRLDHPPVIDVGVSRRMGLFVVVRLAARHGIRVRLKQAQPRGLSALVWLPESVAQAGSCAVELTEDAGRSRRAYPAAAPAPPVSASFTTLPAPSSVLTPDDLAPAMGAHPAWPRPGSGGTTSPARTFFTVPETGPMVSMASGRGAWRKAATRPPPSLTADRRDKCAVACRNSSMGHAGVARTLLGFLRPMKSEDDGTETRGKPVSTQGDPPQDLNWLVTDFAGRVPDVAHAVIVSSHGLVVAVSAGFPENRAERLAAVTAGLSSLVHGAAGIFEAGSVAQTVVEMDAGVLVVMTISHGANLGRAGRTRRQDGSDRLRDDPAGRAGRSDDHPGHPGLGPGRHRGQRAVTGQPCCLRTGRE